MSPRPHQHQQKTDEDNHRGPYPECRHCKKRSHPGDICIHRDTSFFARMDQGKGKQSAERAGQSSSGSGPGTWSIKSKGAKIALAVAKQARSRSESDKSEVIVNDPNENKCI